MNANMKRWTLIYFVGCCACQSRESLHNFALCFQSHIGIGVTNYDALGGIKIRLCRLRPHLDIAKNVTGSVVKVRVAKVREA